MQRAKRRPITFQDVRRFNCLMVTPVIAYEGTLGLNVLSKRAPNQHRGVVRPPIVCWKKHLIQLKKKQYRRKC